jgi:hypothetical protein
MKILIFKIKEQKVGVGTDCKVFITRMLPSSILLCNVLIPLWTLIGVQVRTVALIFSRFPYLFIFSCN